MTKASDNVFPRLLISEGGSTATPASGNVTVYAKANGLLYSKDDAGAESALGPDLTSISDQGAFTYLDATDAAAPADPSAGYARIYSKAGRIYSRDSGGTEYGPFDAAGGAGGPLLFIDDIALHADGDEFDDTALPSWTKVGSGTATAVTTEGYDATCIDLQFSAVSDRIYKAIDAGDWTYYLTTYGATNSTPSTQTALAGMISLIATDNSGAGTGVSLYNDWSGWMWGATANAYASSGSTVLTGVNYATTPAASNWSVTYMLKKVGTTITGGISLDGGLTFMTATRTDSTTFTRIGITRLYTNGGTTPTLRIGRFNLVS